MDFLWNPTVIIFDFTIGDWSPYEGVQKVGGFGRGFKIHRIKDFPYWHFSNQIRLGYSRASYKHPIKLWLYANVDGQPIQQEMGVYAVGTKLTARLDWCSNRLIGTLFEVNGRAIKHVHYDIETDPSKYCIGYRLYSYAETDGDSPTKSTDFNVELTNVVIK
jgi:hypothetical protein